jgi:hypothetical protein
VRLEERDGTAALRKRSCSDHPRGARADHDRIVIPAARTSDS